MRRSIVIDSKYNFNSDDFAEIQNTDTTFSTQNQLRGSVPMVPELPPRIDRASKPNGVTPPSTLLPTPSARNSTAITNGSGATYGRTTHERLFAGSTKPLTDNNHPTYEDEYSTRLLTTTDKRNSANGSSLERKITTPLIDKLMRTPTSVAPPTATDKANSSYDSVSSYDSCCNTAQLAMQNLRLGPNAPDDLKSVPNVK